MGRAGQAQGLVQGLLGRRRFDDGARPPIESRDLVHEFALGDIGQPAQNALALFGIRLGDQLDLVDANELFPFLANAVERFENLRDLPLHGAAGHEAFERRAGFLVGRRDGEDLLVGLDGLGQIAQRDFENLRQPVGERNDLFLGIRQADLATNDVRQILPALGHGVETIERD